MLTIRRALIGQRCQTPQGFTGTVSGINSDNGLARLVFSPGAYLDVPQDDLTPLDRTRIELDAIFLSNDPRR
jgi:hypothetical protein